VLGLARNQVLERLAADWIERAERQFNKTGQPQRIFGSLAYKAAGWDRPRRVIVKAKHTAQGPNSKFITINVPGDPQEL
jgi:Transposase DDE domain group 1